MANVINANLTRDTNNPPDGWCVLWRLALSMIQAGWQIKACGDGLNTKVTGLTDITGFLAVTTNWNSISNVGGGGTGPSVTVKEYNGLLTITGVSGLISPTASDPGSEGNIITFAGFNSVGNNGSFQIAEVLSATSCKIWNPSGFAGDLNNGNVGVTWQEKTFKTVSYTASTWASRAPWIVLEGTRIIKVPVNAAPSSSFIIGETVYQGVSVDTQRRGTLLGVVMNSTSTSGWMVIDPHDYGTWDNSTDIVGLTSSATLPLANISATPKIYANEIVIAKSSSNFYTGSCYWWCGDRVGEDSDSFSYMAANNVSVTTSVAPGFTPTTFPTNAVVIFGGNAAHQSFISSAAFQMGTYAQVMVVNALPRAERAADGTFSVAWHTAPALVTDASYAFSWQRLDDVEPGDVCPFAAFATGATIILSNYDKKGNLAGACLSSSAIGTNTANITSVYWTSFCARGCGVSARDIVQPYGLFTNQVGSVSFISTNNAEAFRISNHPDATPPYRVERGVLYNDGSANLTGGVISQIKSVKGKPRWFRYLGAGSRLSTFDTKQWLALTAYDSTYGSIVIGPYNGTTTPLAT